MSQGSPPKRVILRLRVSEFEGCNQSDFNQAIKAYLNSVGRSMQEFDQGRHYSHIEPFQSLDIRQTSFHIILDLEKDLLDNPDFGTLQHEVYRVRRDIDGKL